MPDDDEQPQPTEPQRPDPTKYEKKNEDGDRETKEERRGRP